METMNAFQPGHLKTGSLDWRRRKEFICDQCGLPGQSACVNTKRHNGTCKIKYLKNLKIRLAAKN